VVSFPQVSPPKSCMHFSPSSHVLHTVSDNFWMDVILWFVILFSAFECPTVHYTWRDAEYSGGYWPCPTDCRDPHIWRSALQLGQICVFQYWDTVGLRKYHKWISDVGIKWSTEQYEVRKFRL
jgi:hypothetical protein